MAWSWSNIDWSATASWVQAVGTIAAVFATARIANQSAAQAWASEARARAEAAGQKAIADGQRIMAAQMLVEQAQRQKRGLISILRKGGESFRANSDIHLLGLNTSLESLDRFPSHALFPPDLVGYFEAIRGSIKTDLAMIDKLLALKITGSAPEKLDDRAEDAAQFLEHSIASVSNLEKEFEKRLDWVANSIKNSSPFEGASGESSEATSTSPA